MEHGHGGVPRYEFEDTENQRRYLMGYERGQMERRFVSRDAAKESVAAFQKLAERMTNQRHWDQSVWTNRIVFPKP